MPPTSDDPIRRPITAPPADEGGTPLDPAAERRRRRALFLRELDEARELRARVQPRRTRERRLREALRRRTFRI